MKAIPRTGVLGEIRELIGVFLGRPFPRRPEQERPKVAVILGAQVLRGGKPSRTLEARTRHAGTLYARGSIDLLIPTGGEGEHQPTEAEVMAGILREMGVPEPAVQLETLARNTWESALLVSAVARDRGLGEALVVTDPLHCVRTVASFERAGLLALAEPVYSSPMWREKWSRGGQFVRESGALVWYRIRHGVGVRSRP